MNKIKQYRNELNLSIYEVASRSGLTPSYISNLENGHKVNPSKEAMEKISMSLNKSVQKVFFPNEH